MPAWIAAPGLGGVRCKGHGRGSRGSDYGRRAWGHLLGGVKITSPTTGSAACVSTRWGKMFMSFFCDKGVCMSFFATRGCAGSRTAGRPSPRVDPPGKGETCEVRGGGTFWGAKGRRFWRAQRQAKNFLEEKKKKEKEAGGER